MTSDNIVYIYVLFEEEDEGNVRYVGKTTDLARRYREHLADVSNTHKSHWIQGLLSIGRKIKIEVVETLTDATEGEWEFSEKFWLNFYRTEGCKLTNQREGGVGYSHTDETKEKCRLAKLGHSRAQTEKTKAKISSTMSKLTLGEGNNAALLTEQQVIEIRTKFAQRLLTQYQLAAEYGVSRCCIAGITQGRNWKHIGGPITTLPPTHKKRNTGRSEFVKDL